LYSFAIAGVFMIRAGARRRPVSTVAISLAIGLVAAVTIQGCNLQTLGGPKGSLKLYATFSDAQHLVPGHAVKVGDVTVGTVTHVSLVGYRAKVTMSIVDSQKIPSGTTAALNQTSLLGENYVELQYPTGAKGAARQYVTSGDTLEVSSIEPSLEHFASRAIQVLGAVQSGDVSTILDAGAKAFGGRGAELNLLLRQVNQITGTVANQKADLGGLIDSLGSLGRQLAGHSLDIQALLSNLATTVSELGGQRFAIVQTVDKLTSFAQSLTQHVLAPHLAQLKELLAQLAPVTATLGQDAQTIGSLLEDLATISLLGPHGLIGRDLLIYIWIAGVTLPDGTVVPIGAPVSQNSRSPEAISYLRYLKPPT
jgi:phospholipid/cholesterol/gamma-HCH transport system substrate-binding protein